MPALLKTILILTRHCLKIGGMLNGEKFLSNQGKFLQTGCRPARKFSVERQKKSVVWVFFHFSNQVYARRFSFSLDSRKRSRNDIADIQAVFCTQRIGGAHFSKTLGNCHLFKGAASSGLSQRFCGR